jgi:ParB family chromosome partitioning protein
MTTSTTPAPTAVSDSAGMRLEHIDPSTLLIDANIRSTAELDSDFVESVREFGVMQAITAIEAPDGIRVRMGQRRTLAAIQAGRPTVPVIVMSAASDDEADRILRQWHENELRRGLNVSDQVAVAEQLAAFGMNAGEIAGKLHTSPDHVGRALAVAGSALARKAAPRYDLTLDQAAALAEFEGQEDTIKALVAAAQEGPGRFEHTLQYARDERAKAQQVAAIEADLAARGVRLITGTEGRAPKAKPLDDLTADLATRRPITPAKHKNCPGHAAYVMVWSWKDKIEPVYVCTDWKAHSHAYRYGSTQPPAADTAGMTEAEAEAQQEAAREVRRTVIKNNRAWDSAVDVRVRFLKAYLARKTRTRAAPSSSPASWPGAAGRSVRRWSKAPGCSSSCSASAGPAARPLRTRAPTSAPRSSPWRWSWPAWRTASAATAGANPATQRAATSPS